MTSLESTADYSQRFRSAADWFTTSAKGGIHTFHIGAPSERAVDLMHALSAHFPERARVFVSSLRDRKSWRAADSSRAEFRDALARLKLLLAGYGGVEIVIYNHEDQLTLTPELQLVIYSRSGVWRERLVKMGLELRKKPPTAVWCPPRKNLRSAPELVDSVAHTVKRLGLQPVSYGS